MAPAGLRDSLVGRRQSRDRRSRCGPGIGWLVCNCGRTVDHLGRCRACRGTVTCADAAHETRAVRGCAAAAEDWPSPPLSRSRLWSSPGRCVAMVIQAGREGPMLWPGRKRQPSSRARSGTCPDAERPGDGRAANRRSSQTLTRPRFTAHRAHSPRCRRTDQVVPDTALDQGLPAHARRQQPTTRRRACSTCWTPRAPRRPWMYPVTEVEVSPTPVHQRSGERGGSGSLGMRARAP